MQRKILSKDEIKLIANKIKEKFNPEKIILFGSYAYGKPDKESDIDLLVILNTEERYPKVAARIQLHLDEATKMVYPMDIIVRTPQDVEERYREGDFFIKTILDKGIYL